MSGATTARKSRVLVGFDGSARALPALDLAADEALRRGTTLEILCGWPWGRHRSPDMAMAPGGPSLHQLSRASLDRAVTRVHGRARHLPVVPTLTTEPAARALVRAGRTAALTVVGTRGHGGFGELLLGSVTLRVAAHCTGPLLVVRGSATNERNCVLVGLESEADLGALRFGFEEAARRGAVLRVLHAWRYPAAPSLCPPAPLQWDDVQLLAKSAEAVPEYAVAALRGEHPGVEVDTVAMCLGAGHALTEASRTADVVVVSAHRRARRLGLQLGPVTHTLLHHAHCPVALVPDTRSGPTP
ncbi:MULTISPECIES: universal stress protein [Streptomyces]|uniref:Universal stress protein n=1 Tax=Streptomyces morookaense TaxID=1970 RepID=A0A7Y7B528_STRMO|nr:MULTISPECIES: universal stress protein [Streptomyces]MCC2273909.1 universal stress protein [Streptomyces sp. ET3-23]NVK78761.1 universal stress protein [Streptomyces morookaense]GHF34553.1 universal stress protein [Streptomyces morookaense]